MLKNEIIVYFDGAAKGNPGPAGVGVVFLNQDGSVINEINFYIGHRTNNQAEYEALLVALKHIPDFALSQVILRTDSELLFRQMGGKYKVKNVELKKYHSRAKALLAALPNVRLEFFPREYNYQADRLAKQAIKKHLKTQTEPK